MKPDSLRLAFALLVTAATLGATPLAQTTAVFIKPDATTPAVTIFSAGTEPVLAPDQAAPAGWIAVTLAGPHTVYVANGDINKALNVHPGAPYRTAPKADAPVLALAHAGDNAQISGLYGPWTVYTLPGAITGYIQSATIAAAPVPASPPVVAPVKSMPSSATTTAAAAPSPASTVATTATATPGTAAPMGDGGSSALPHFYQGSFVTSHSFLHPNPPYPYQINDNSGQPYAYLDLSNILDTIQLGDFLGRTVTIYGVAQAMPGAKQILIHVQSMQLQ